MKKPVCILFGLLIAVGASFADITMISPFGGEKWIMGMASPIRWNPGGNAGSVRIRLRKGSIDLENIISDTENDGTFEWNVDKLENGMVI